MNCSCLACIQHFGKCSTTGLVLKYRSAGIARPAARYADDKVYFLNEKYAGGVTADGAAWGSLSTAPDSSSPPLSQQEACPDQSLAPLSDDA